MKPSSDLLIDISMKCVGMPHLPVPNACSKKDTYYKRKGLVECEDVTMKYAPHWSLFIDTEIKNKAISCVGTSHNAILSQLAQDAI